MLYILSASTLSIYTRISDTAWLNIWPWLYFLVIHLISCLLILVIFCHFPIYSSQQWYKKSSSCKSRLEEWWDHCALKFPLPFQSTNGAMLVPAAMSCIYTVSLLHLSSFHYNRGGQQCHVFSDMTVISGCLCQEKKINVFFILIP